MTPKENIQSTFLEQIKKNLLPGHSFADELAELLTISRDSAYRRIRGETILSLEEVSILSLRFGVSVDAFLSPQTETVSFQIRFFDENSFSFEKWIRSILGHLESFIAYPGTDKELIYNAKDLPIFHYFQFPRLAAFKIYFWMKTFGHSKFNSSKYNPEEINKELIAIGQRIWERYIGVASTEIMTNEILNVTLRQIEYAHECGMFVNKDEAKWLLEDCQRLTTQLKTLAMQGFKSALDDEKKGGPFEVYINDLVLGDNTILFKLGEKRITFITPNGYNLLSTSQEFFGRLTESNMENLKSKAVLISATAEKDRNRYFNHLESLIAAMGAKIN